MHIPSSHMQPPPPAPVQLRKVKVLWLRVSDTENYLLLEDTETGDVLLPLIYMKSIFEANYSRKLSSLKHRLVVLPAQYQASLEAKAGKKRPGVPDSEQEVKSDFVYWQWAFEAPHEVKVLVRQALGEENTPHGHLRLILLPIVFNAMAQKQKLRQMPLFKALHAALSKSTYFSLLKLPQNVEAELAEFDQSRLSLSIGNDEQALFAGPFDLDKTISKYTITCDVAEEIQSNKRARTGRVDVTSARFSPPRDTGSPSSQGNDGRSLKSDLLNEEAEILSLIRRQTEEMSTEMRRLRGECEANMNWIYIELHNLRRWMAEMMQTMVANSGGNPANVLKTMNVVSSMKAMPGLGGMAAPSLADMSAGMTAFNGPTLAGVTAMRDLSGVGPASFNSKGPYAARAVAS